ncbi:MAG: hypothetical protein ABIH71_00395, partial [Candidatus Omnitrophota bacterium]
QTKLLANTIKSHLDNLLIKEMDKGLPISSLGTGNIIAKENLREKIDILRVSSRNALFKAKQDITNQIDNLSSNKLKEAETGLLNEKLNIKNKVEFINQQKIKSLIQKTNNLDEQLKIHEQYLNQAKLNDLPTKMIENKINRLSNDYWYYTGEIAERLQDIPELAKGTSFSNKINEIEGLLKKGIEVDLGRSGSSLGNKLLAINKEIGNKDLLIPGFRIGKKGKSLLKELSDMRARRDMGYVPRITNQEAQQYLRQAKIGNSKVWNTNLANQLKRSTADFTLQEFNDFVAANGLSSLGGKTVEQFFMKNPAYFTVIRGVRSVKATTSADFLKDAGDIFAKTTKEIPYGQELPESILKLYPQFKGKVFDPEILEEIVKADKRLFNPDELNDFVKGWDTIQNYWKRWTLMPFAKYHIRNSLGNVWNNYLADVTDPQAYLKAAQLQEYAMTKNPKALSTFGKQFFTPQQADEILVQTKKLGITKGTQFRGDIPTTIERQIKGDFSPTGLGMKAGGVIEDNARIAHFVDKLGKGMTADQAALSVKKYLFDYNDLTYFEKNIMKRALPFYTWSRKNIPLQLETLINKPQKMIPMVKLLQNRDEKSLLLLKYTQPSLYERLPVEYKKDVDSKTYVPLEGIIPSADLTKIARPQELFFELLNPYAKTGIELLPSKGYSFYTEKPIVNYEGETQEFLKMNLPAKTVYAIKGFLPWSRMVFGINDLIKKKLRKEKLTPEEIAFDFALSKVYKKDLDEARSIAIWKMKQASNELKKGYRTAVKMGREEEMENIINKHDEIMKRIKQLNP